MTRRWLPRLMVVCGLSVLAVACSDTPTEADIVLTMGERTVLASLSPVPLPPASPTNAWADDPKAATLGQALFFEKRLSVNGEIACATCHDPEKWFADDRKTAKGVAVTSRHTPTALGAAHMQWLFWDGRADSVWAQALGPLENPKEHGTNRMAVLHIVGAHHRAAWEAVFGPWPDLSDAKRFPKDARPVAELPSDPHAIAWAAMAPEDRTLVNELFTKVGKAIAAYERLLVPGEAPFDRYVAAVMAGDSTGGGHLSPAAQRGVRLFLDTDNRCVFCHAGPRFTTDVFFNIGVEQPAWSASPDRGRYDGGATVLLDLFNCFGAFSDATDKPVACKHLGFLDPNSSGTVGAFKVPSLRNVAHTAPYMHAGQYATLADVVDHYNEIENHQPAVGLKEPFLRDLDLTKRDKADLVAFLQSLSGPKPSGPLATDPTP